MAIRPRLIDNVASAASKSSHRRPRSFVAGDHDPRGFRVTDVWTSRAAWDTFEASGLPTRLGTPKKDFFEVVNYLT